VRNDKIYFQIRTKLILTLVAIRANELLSNTLRLTQLYL